MPAEGPILTLRRPKGVHFQRAAVRVDARPVTASRRVTSACFAADKSIHRRGSHLHPVTGLQLPQVGRPVSQSLAASLTASSPSPADPSPAPMNRSGAIPFG